MAKKFVLSEKERDLLQDFIEFIRSKPRNSPNNYEPPTDPDDHLAPEVYIALTPENGIPGRQGVVPGQNICDIYRLWPNGTERSIRSLALQRMVYNLSPVAIDGEEYLPVWRDKFGHWLAQAQATESFDTGTGSGTGTTCVNTIPIETVRCEDGPDTGTDVSSGILNKYRVYYSFEIINGQVCITQSEEEWVETVGCCDPDCGEQFTGTGTGTMGTRDTGTSTGEDDPVGECEPIDCQDCSGGSPPGTPDYWVLFVSGFGGVCNVWNGGWVLTQVSACKWEQVGSLGEVASIEFIGNNRILLLFTYTIDGVDYKAAYIAQYNGSCCIEYELSINFSSCAQYPRTITAQPHCCEDEEPVGTGSPSAPLCCAPAPDSILSGVIESLTECVCANGAPLDFNRDGDVWEASDTFGSCAMEVINLVLRCDNPSLGINGWVLDYSFAFCGSAGTVSPNPGGDCLLFGLSFDIPLSPDCCDGTTPVIRVHIGSSTP